MISLFLLIFAIHDGLATEDATLRDVVNGLQMTVNEMNSKMERLENEVKVRVILVIHESWIRKVQQNSFCNRGSLLSRFWKAKTKSWNQSLKWKRSRNRFYENTGISKLRRFLNRKKADVNYLLMEMTKITDRVDILENESNDETEETKSVGAVNIEFTGDHLFSAGATKRRTFVFECSTMFAFFWTLKCSMFECSTISKCSKVRMFGCSLIFECSDVLCSNVR